MTLDADVLEYAKAAARAQRRTIGEVVSDWARQGFERSSADAPEPDQRLLARGIVTLPKREGMVTSEMVYSLMDELEI